MGDWFMSLVPRPHTTGNEARFMVAVQETLKAMIHCLVIVDITQTNEYGSNMVPYSSNIQNMLRKKEKFQIRACASNPPC